MNNAEAQAIALYEHCLEFNAHAVVCEEPTSMGLEGRTTNAVGKLLYHVGVLRGQLLTMNRHLEWVWYSTPAWKGQLAQGVVVDRVNKVLGLNLNAGKGSTQDVDIAHAIGIGLYHLSRTIGKWEHDPYFGSRGGIKTGRILPR